MKSDGNPSLFFFYHPLHNLKETGTVTVVLEKYPHYLHYSPRNNRDSPCFPYEKTGSSEPVFNITDKKDRYV
jgi:hypothetical protein